MQVGTGGIPSTIPPPPPSLPSPPHPPRQEGTNTMADPPACIEGGFFWRAHSQTQPQDMRATRR